MSDLKIATVPELIEMLGTADSEMTTAAAKELVSRDEKSAGPVLLDILVSTSDGGLRNVVAIALSDLKEQRAFDILVGLLADDSTQNNRGTLLYALAAYDCSSILILLVTLAIEGNFEVSNEALSIIDQIETEVDETTWDTCIRHIREAILADSHQRPLLVELLSRFDG